MIDRVVVLLPTRHKISHLEDVSPSQSLSSVRKKLNLTHDKSTHSPIERNILQHKINTKKPKPSLVAFYDIRSGNGAGLISKDPKISKGAWEEISKEKVKKK